MKNAVTTYAAAVMNLKNLTTNEVINNDPRTSECCNILKSVVILIMGMINDFLLFACVLEPTVVLHYCFRIQFSVFFGNQITILGLFQSISEQEELLCLFWQ